MSAPRCWFAVVDQRPDEAWATSEAFHVDDRPFGWIGVWRYRERPTRHAMLADARAFDRDGPSGWVSLLLVGANVRILFDDPAVQRARQSLLEYNPFSAVTTLARDASHFGGSLVARHDPAAPAAVMQDPFRLVDTPSIIHVGPGLLGASPALPAPVIERYGGQPWPVDRFRAATPDRPGEFD